MYSVLKHETKTQLMNVEASARDSDQASEICVLARETIWKQNLAAYALCLSQQIPFFAKGLLPAPPALFCSLHFGPRQLETFLCGEEAGPAEVHSRNHHNATTKSKGPPVQQEVPLYMKPSRRQPQPWFSAESLVEFNFLGCQDEQRKSGIEEETARVQTLWWKTTQQPHLNYKKTTKEFLNREFGQNLNPRIPVWVYQASLKGSQTKSTWGDSTMTSLCWVIQINVQRDRSMLFLSLKSLYFFQIKYLQFQVWLAFSIFFSLSNVWNRSCEPIRMLTWVRLRVRPRWNEGIWRRMVCVCWRPGGDRPDQGARLIFSHHHTRWTSALWLAL